MGKMVKRMVKSKQDWMEVLDARFAYMSQEERRRLIEGETFMKIPSKELKRLRVDAYPYLM